MAYRLVALDLDGTLLSSQKTISPRNLLALRRLAQEGVHICIATGRALKTASDFTTCLDFPHTLAVYNGALLVDQPSGAELFRHYLQPFEVREILACFDKLEITGRRDVLTDDCWYFAPSTDAHTAVVQRSGLPYAALPSTWPELTAAKAMATATRDTGRTMLQRMRQELPGYSIVLSTASLLEVMAGGVGKGAAIARLAQRLGIAIEDTVAFGDHVNDIDMLQTAGYGVAMGNGAEEAKQAADLVTAHCDEDGVALALESLFSLAS